MRRAAVAAALAIAAGCAGEAVVDLRVIVVGEDPFLGADVTEVRVRAADGTLLAVETQPLAARTVSLGPLPFGAPLRVEVETRIGTLPLAAGRSFPFVVPGPGAPPSDRVDVTLGLLGRHAPVGSLPATPERIVVVANETGAWLVERGMLRRWRAHGADGRPTLEQVLDLAPARRGAEAAGLGEGLLLVGGASAGATWIDADGGAHSLDDPLLAAAEGAAVVTVDGGVLVVGGRAEDGTLLDAVLQVRVQGGGLRVAPLAPLPSPRAGAQAIAFVANGSRGPEPRVLVEGGEGPSGPTFELVVLDPAGGAAPVPWTSPRPRRAVALAALAAGQVMLAGGIDASGSVVSEVDVLVVDVERPLELLAPSPDTLFRARAGAVAVPIAPGLALVLGGAAPDGAPIDTAELADLRLVPGRVRLTGALPDAGLPTRAAALGDGTLLVASGRNLSLYFPFPP